MTTGAAGRSAARAAAGVALALAAALPASAQGACATRSGPPAAAHAAWRGPLGRVVEFHARDVALRDALDRLGAAARVRLSYSREALPLDRAVCLSHDAVTLGDALAELLRGTGVEAVAVGDDAVVLTPRARAAAARRADAAPAAPDGDSLVAARGARLLDRVVVTGSASGASQRPLTIALDVIDGPALARRNGGTLSQLLDDLVPGVWAWEQSPTSLVARYGSIRGASSFGANYPKVYVDGIEVANPLLAVRLDLDAVERIEVIRGPQGAALYGADAISGVVNVVTRHEGAPGGGVQARLRTGGGVAGTDYAAGTVVAQQHAFTLRAGSQLRSGGLAVSVTSLGDYAPRARSRDVLATGDVRLVGARTSLTGVARLADRRAGATESPAVAAVLPADGPTTADPPRQSARQYTLGATGTFVPDERWTHQLTVGVDGYRLANAADDGAPVPGLADRVATSPLARSGADRVSLRAGAVTRGGDPAALAGSLTFALEHSSLREAMDLPVVAPREGDLPDAPTGWATATTTRWLRTTGAVAQGSGAWRDRWFATAGLRVEGGAGTGFGNLELLPMLGAATVHAVGPATVKLRAAYGKGIRATSTALRESGWMGVRRPLVAIGLEPEAQAGVEGGMDLLVGRAVGLHVTRFDQRATGLIQPVIVGMTSGSAGVGGAASTVRRVTYVLQNVGEIRNDGWELRATASAGALSATGTLALVDSRVARLAPGYSGDLRPGDRMLEVPARTASLGATWTARRWATSWTVARAADWTGYDRLALARTVSDDGYDPHELEGAALRDYWRRYDGVTRLRASFTHDLTRGLSLRLVGDNLLDQQRGEPDNATVLPGRTVTAEMRVSF